MEYIPAILSEVLSISARAGWVFLRASIWPWVIVVWAPCFEFISPKIFDIASCWVIIFPFASLVLINFFRLTSSAAVAFEIDWPKSSALKVFIFLPSFVIIESAAVVASTISLNPLLDIALNAIPALSDADIIE